MKVLAYVHLRNINNSTGAGRVARNIVEALLLRGEDEIRILADRSDHGAISRDVGPPWADLKYHLFRLDTSAQQRMWYLFNAPKAEDYWPEVEVVYCAGESYVPKRRARLAVLVHDAAFFDDGALERNFRFRLQQFRWNMLYRKLDRHADMFHTVSKFSAERLGHYFPSIRSRLTVIPNAVTEVFFSNDRSNDSEHLAKWGLRGRSYVLLPRGLWYRKNADLLLDAWPRLREMHKDLLLVVTSDNDPVFVERATRLDKSIVLTGFIEDTELR